LPPHSSHRLPFTLKLRFFFNMLFSGFAIIFL
jgi:hypothetical protein